MLDTLPRREPHRGIGGELGHKSLHDCRLADPRLAREEEELAHTLTGLRQRRVQAYQYGLASDERCGGGSHVAAGRRGEGEGRCQW
jgi:hypothetical protein